MTDILVQPTELRSAGEQLNSRAKSIGQAMQSIDNDMHALKGHNFLGNRANELQSNYASKREALVFAQKILVHFAAELKTAAEAFEKADLQHNVPYLPDTAGILFKDGWMLPLAPLFPSEDFTWPVLPFLPILPFRFARDGFGFTLPQWLTTKLDQFYAPAEIASSFAAEQPAVIAVPSQDFGDLLKQPVNTPIVETSSPEPSPLEISYTVQAKPQGKLYGNAACSPTSVSMILDYYHSKDAANQTISAEQLVLMMDEGDGTYGKGMSLSKLTDELSELGYHNISQKVDARFSDLHSALQDGPVIVTTGVKISGPGTISPNGPRTLDGAGNAIHAMVVTGIGDTQVNVNDPWTGQELQLSKATFERMWSRGSNGIYSIRP